VLALLKDIYNSKVPSGYTREVILITDGQVGNEAEVTELIKRGSNTRLFTVGTYVPGHRRSAPNQYKWDNYGEKSQNNTPYYSPYSSYNRDYDRDGILNQYDMDDDNDGKLDDYDRD